MPARMQVIIPCVLCVVFFFVLFVVIFFDLPKTGRRPSVTGMLLRTLTAVPHRYSLISPMKTGTG